MEDTQEKWRTDLKEIKNVSTNIESKFFVLSFRKSNTLVGSILYGITDKISTATFGLFAVHPNFQGKRLGNRLLEVVESYALSQGKIKIKIEVLELASSLVSYYEKINYVKFDKKIPFSEISKAQLKKQYLNDCKAVYIVMKKELID